MNERTPDSGCNEWAELISAYFDGQLSETQARAVESHLASCPRCARQLEDYTLFRSLMNAERQENSLDLNAAVMASMEREQLLEGLDLVIKPPVPRWVKLVRALSAAAMLGLIVGTVVLVMRFNTNSHEVPLASDSLKLVLPPKTEPAMPAQPGKGVPALARENTRSGPTLKGVGPAMMPMEPSTFADVRPEKSIAAATMSKAPVALETQETAPATLGWDTETGAIQSNRPLALRPVGEASAVTTQPDEKATADTDLAWPIPLVYRLATPDLPAWMLLKEQILIVLKESGIPQIHEHFRVRQALDEGREFFYLAKKGLDLRPGPVRSQILLVTTPENFARIYDYLQFSISETVDQTLPDELASAMRTRTVSAGLTALADRSDTVLRRSFGSDKEFDVLADVPVTTSATVRAMHPATFVASSRFVPETESASTQSAPATQPADGLKMLPVLIAIEIKPKSPAILPTTAPATRPTTLPADAEEN